MKIEEILAQCIDDIRSGKASLQDCLDRYPELRDELEPLLNLSLDIDAPDSRPSDTFKAQARYNLMEYIREEQAKKNVKNRAGIGQGWFTGWARAVSIAVAIILFIGAAGTGTAFASQSSIPGDALYTVKLGTEQVQRLLTPDEDEVDLELKFAEIRLDEIEEIASMQEDATAITAGKPIGFAGMSIIGIDREESEVIFIPTSERMDKAIEGYENNLTLAISKAEKLADNETALEKVALTIIEHFKRIDQIEDTASGNASGIVTDSRTIAVNGYFNAVEKLAVANPVRTNEINLEAIQNRLERAETTSTSEKGKAVEDALQDYERMRDFGSELSDSAGKNGQDTSVIDEMNAKAAKEQLDTLDSIYENVPQENRNIVEQAIESTVEEHGRVIEENQQQNIPEETSAKPETPVNPADEPQQNPKDHETEEPGNSRK